MMPEMDGLDAMRAIRNLPRLKALPIIALTAKAMKGDREDALAAGASEYVAKPVDPDRLLAVLHVWLSGRARAELPPAQNGFRPREEAAAART